MKEIRIQVDPRENFTPAGLMKRYADQTAGVQFGRSYWGTAQLTINGNVYEYHHWSITAEKGVPTVTLYLLEVKTRQSLNIMCLSCPGLGNGCDGTTEKVWTGCAMRGKYL